MPPDEGSVRQRSFVSPTFSGWYSYISVHLTGTARIADQCDARDHVDRLSDQFERRLKGKRPWTTAKMTPAKRDAMLRAIVVVEIAVESIEGEWKLGQHKSPADQASVAKMLEWRADWSSLALVEVIRRLRRDQAA